MNLYIPFLLTISIRHFNISLQETRFQRLLNVAFPDNVVYFLFCVFLLCRRCVLLIVLSIPSKGYWVVCRVPQRDKYSSRFSEKSQVQTSFLLPGNLVFIFLQMFSSIAFTFPHPISLITIFVIKLLKFLKVSLDHIINSSVVTHFSASVVYKHIIIAISIEPKLAIRCFSWTITPQ